jgi:hypothetical protein
MPHPVIVDRAEVHMLQEKASRALVVMADTPA